MRIKSFTDERGLALIATLLLLALVAVLTTTALTGAMNALRTSGSDYQDTRVFYAAEAGAEATLAQLKVALLDGYLSPDELTNMKPPDLNAVDFDSFAVNKVGDEIVETITDGPFAGLYALTQNVDIYSRAANAAGDVSAVILRAKAQAIPIFQFGVFFEQDLEATNGPPMEFVGRVHSNGNIYLSSDNAWYRDLVTTPNKIIHDRKDFHSVKNGVYVNDSGGTEVPLDFDSRTHADPEAFKAKSCDRFDCRVQTDAFGVDSLSLPLPDGVPPYELLMPRENSDVDAERQVKFAWNADMYIEVDLGNISTKEDVCMGGGPKKDPDEVGGDLQVTALQKVEPGATVQFKILNVPCGEIDDVDVQITADGVTFFSVIDLQNCIFQATIPIDANDVVLTAIGDDDGIGTVMNGSAFWYGLQYVNDLAPWPATTITRSSGGDVPAAKDMCNMFWWDWASFYDGREKELKDVLNIDIAQIVAWAGGSSSRSSEVIYVEIKVPNTINGYSQETLDLILDGTLDPAVRVLNGQTLPNPMSLASEWPLYVKGDYNRFAKKPAALAGDGITILSNAWDDANNKPPGGTYTSCTNQTAPNSPCAHYLTWQATWTKGPSLETWVNAAILAGHTATPCDHEDSSCIADGSSAYYTDWYGGGLENFPRFLERWYNTSGVRQTLHFVGALISPFTSQKTTGTWNGSYYSPPQRDWQFDTDFQDPRLLPPGTPNVGYVLRTAMREAY
jgi:hypothetical protein